MDDSQDGKQSSRERTAALVERFKYMLDTDPEFREQMEQAAMRIASNIQQMHTEIAAVTADLASGVQALQKKLVSIANQVEPVLRNLFNGFEQLPEAIHHAVISLAQESWFISPDMSLTEPSEAAELFTTGRRDEGNQRLAAYFESIVDEIETTLTEALPQRARLISSAFSAHRRGEYELAIPVLFAQADGVCADLAKGSLFQSDRSQAKGAPARPETAAFVDAMESDVFWTALLSPLGQKIPINFNVKERGSGLYDLNRHMVMHGESLGYGTAINSLKCISLLSYVAWVLKESQ
jgi:hypothetical protein